MELKRPSPWWNACPWTLATVALLTAANLGLLAGDGSLARTLPAVLEFDRQAIHRGELWRLVTGNFVHWSAEHFLLDAGAFAVVGFLYERHVRQYPCVLLACALAVGFGVFALLPDMATYRGLSGVDSGQFAAALWAETGLARIERRRWLWLAPVFAVFCTKVLWEMVSGQMFFGTESLGNIGSPVALAHAAGIAAAVILLAGLSLSQARRAQRSRPSRSFANLRSAATTGLPPKDSAGEPERRSVGCRVH